MDSLSLSPERHENIVNVPNSTLSSYILVWGSADNHVTGPGSDLHLYHLYAEVKLGVSYRSYPADFNHMLLACHILPSTVQQAEEGGGHKSAVIHSATALNTFKYHHDDDQED